MKIRFPARTVREFKELLETDRNDVDFVRNLDDWKYRIRNADSKDHPLEPLTEEQLHEFTNGLVFNNGSIAGARVRILQDNLTDTQDKQVMEWFGMDIVFAADHEGYYCASLGTCKVDDDAICTSNC